MPNTSYSPLPWNRKPSLQLLLGATEIAHLVGVSNPGVVTNWRSRSADFPPDRSAGTQPRFDLVEVLEWLRRSKKEQRQVDPLDWWDTLVRAFAVQATVASPRASLIALLVLRHATAHAPTHQDTAAWTRLREAAAETGPGPDSDGAPLATVLIDVARTTESAHPILAGLLIDQLTVDSATGTYVADLLDAMERIGNEPTTRLLTPVLALGRERRARPAFSTDDTLADTMIDLAEIPPGGSVLDPAAGEGTLLIRCAQTAPTPLHLYGQEIDTEAWRTARSRMFIEGIDADLAEPGHDTLRRDLHRDRRVDVVLIDPPFADDAPPLHLWIEHGLGHLRPEGRLVIALPLHALVPVPVARRRPERQLQSLVQVLASDRLIQSVRVLPRGLRHDIVGPLVLVAIGQAPASGEAITPGTLLADLERLGQEVEAKPTFDVARRKARRPASAPDVDTLSAAARELLAQLEHAPTQVPLALHTRLLSDLEQLLRELS